MKISFNGNHVYKCPDMGTVIGLAERYNNIKIKSHRDMIVYGNDDEDYYVHVIDGKDARKFRIAQLTNKGVVNEPYLFEALAKAFRSKATVVDFSNIPQSEFNI